MQPIHSCPNCGSAIAFGKKFCKNCGTPLVWPAQQHISNPPIYQQPPNYQQQMPTPVYQQQSVGVQSQQSEPLQNTSGQGKLASLPPGVKGWNWGAFFFTWLWGACNKVWISFLILIPIFNIVFLFVLAAKGNEWAWRKKRWDSVEHFHKTQRKWMGWGIGVFFFALAITSLLIAVNS